MQKKFYFVLSLLIVSIFVLSACGQAAAPAEEAKVKVAK